MDGGEGMKWRKRREKEKELMARWGSREKTGAARKDGEEWWAIKRG